MKPLDTDQCAFALRRAWMRGARQFESLPVRPDEVDGDKVLYSYWMPDEAERQLIANGSAVRLCCIADEHPPVAVEVITLA